jgi:hypothetical protein
MIGGGATFGASTPTLTLPRKRERGQAAVEVMSLASIEATGAILFAPYRVISKPSIRQSSPPLPLAGEGWGGGTLGYCP